MLLEHGTDRDKENKSRETPLPYAASEGQLEIAILLTSYGADLNARGNNGQLPLPIEVSDNEDMKQAIRDDPRRRMDHGHKSARA